MVVEAVMMLECSEVIASDDGLGQIYPAVRVLATARQEGRPLMSNHDFQILYCCMKTLVQPVQRQQY